LCLDGAASHVDVSALSLDRFEADDEGLVEQNVA
jgi:sarcosine oxidase subunit beta